MLEHDLLMNNSLKIFRQNGQKLSQFDMICCVSNPLLKFYIVVAS